VHYLFVETRAKVEARLKELEPCLQEAEELRRVLAAMDRAEEQKVPSPRLAFAQRREQVIGFLRAEPGARIADIARVLGVTHARAGQIVKRLVEEGEIRKDGHRLFVAE
jgi:DNA-binding MarR family transcriptional regulator